MTKAKGTIRVSSKKGKCSTFIVLIPFRVMNEKHIQRFIQRKTAENTQCNNVILTGKKILLVEDNEINREIASEILEEFGLLVDTAEDGEFAVRKVETNGVDYYDYILMDIMMPYMNGYEATRLIRQMPGGNKIPIIALSANSYDQDRRLSLEAGMNDHLNKPVSVKTLIETLQKLGR